MDPLERDLRQSLSGRKWELSGDPGLLQRVHAGARRRRTTRRSVVAAGTAAALVSAITVTAAVRQPLSTSPSPAGTHTSAPPLAVVPWVDHKVPDPYADVPACRASDLQVISARAHLEGEITLGDVTVENRGTAACVLAGEPRLQAQGIAVRHRTFPLVAGAVEPVITPAYLEPGSRASTTFDVSHDCPDPGEGIEDVSLVLETGEVVHTSIDVPSSCDAFSNPWDRIRPHSDVTLRWTKIWAVIDAPPSVRAGDTLEYTVTLTNKGEHPVQFDTCPTYWQLFEVGQHDVSGVWRLNCSEVPVLEPNQPARFAMRLPIPAEAPARRALLSWGLELSSAFNIEWVTVLE